MHGQFYRHLERPSADKEKSLARLYTSSDLKGETESLIIGGQDQALNTLSRYRNIMEQPIDSKSGMRYKAEEHIKHIDNRTNLLHNFS